jgi:hypothetical protein
MSVVGVKSCRGCQGPGGRPGNETDPQWPSMVTNHFTLMGTCLGHIMFAAGFNSPLIVALQGAMAYIYIYTHIYIA